jgi:hypothetical protein
MSPRRRGAGSENIAHRRPEKDGRVSAPKPLRPFTVFHRASVHKIDIIVRKNDDYEVEKFERRQRKDVEGQSVWVIAPEHLILSKLGWAKQTRSELQLRDVQAMITVQQGLDWVYIDRWAIRLTVRSLLGEMRR